MKTQNTPQLGSAGTQLIKATETLALRAYLCPAHKLTIGYGHVIVPSDYRLFKAFDFKRLQTTKAACEERGVLTAEAKLSLFINPTQAEQLFLQDTQQVAEAVTSLTPVALNQNQFDALISLVFNIGQANYAESTLRKLLKAHDFNGAASEFDRWVNGTVNGKKIKLNGLVTRRAAERALFERPL